MVEEWRKVVVVREEKCALGMSGGGLGFGTGEEVQDDTQGVEH
jgi:hypothetical protein